MMTLTGKQAKIFDFIVSWHVDKGYPPSRNEICQHFGFSSLNSVNCHLRGIEKKGYIHLTSGKARGIQVVSIPHFNSVKNSIPILGKIAAGIPIWAEQNIDGNIPISPDFFCEGYLFALKVCGDSMINAGILNNDIAIVQKQPSVENGEIAAVCIDNEVTLKRFYKVPPKIILKAENPSYEDWVFSSDVAISIIGKLQGILRKGQPSCR